MGDFALGLALPYYTYQLTGSVLATGIAALAANVPRAILGSVAGVFVDRWNRKWTMIRMDFLRAILLLLLLVVHAPGGAPPVKPEHRQDTAGLPAAFTAFPVWARQ